MLAASPVFRNLSPQSLVEVERQFVARGYTRGEPVFTEGSPARALYVLASGRVKISRTTPRGAPVIVDLIVPGEVFGALPSLGLAAYGTTATAMVVSCALGIDAAAFERIVAAHAEVATAALQAVSAQLRAAHEALTRMTLDSAEERLAATLLDLSRRVGHARSDMTLIQLPLTRADLAAMAATTPETASRILSRWKADGWIASGRGWVGIVDAGALCRVAGTGC